MAAPFESLGTLLASHRVASRVVVTALSFTLVLTFTHHTATTQAGEAAPLVPESLLPETVGVAVTTDSGITLTFDTPMDTESVETSLQLMPPHRIDLTWNADATELTLTPQRLWRTDERYLVVVPASALEEDGGPLGTTRRFAFTTEPPPTVSEFQVRLVAADTDAPSEQAEATLGALSIDPVSGVRPPGSQPPTETATEVSATSSITIGFSAPMDRRDVEQRFAITPEVDGDLDWSGTNLVFTPSERLEAGARYTISVIGAHDARGNLLGGKGNFSFIVREGAQLTRTKPDADAIDVERDTVEMWFSAPMDVESTNAAFALVDTSSGALVGGLLSWNEAGTQLVYRPDEPFAPGRTFGVELDGGEDLDGNLVEASWAFTTKAPPPPPPTPAPDPAETQGEETQETQQAQSPAPAPEAPSRSTTSTRSAPAVPPPAPTTSLAGHALNQVNAARAAYGFPPVALDPAISAVAAAHAWDQARNGYFSHTGLNGSTRESRLRAGGVSFSWSGENQCHRIGMSERATLDWCHAQFMSEPYPGHWNHIANILNPNARRMGVGIATVNGRTVITWNFTN